MTTRKKYTDKDFDEFTEENLDEQITAIAQTHPKYLITEKKFVGRLGDGRTIELPLTIKLKDFEELTVTEDDPLTQLKTLLTRFGGEQEAAKLIDADVTDCMYLARTYFDIFQKIVEKSLGK